MTVEGNKRNDEAEIQRLLDDGVTTTKGRFNAFRGELSLDEQHPASSWVEAEVDEASIDTHIKLRDAHLRSAPFFAARQYPTITFQSTRVEHSGGSAYKVTGNLTLLGVTKPVTFDVDYRGQSAGIDTRASLTARATINRHEFGLGQGTRLQFAAGETADVEIALEAVQTPAQAQTREAAVMARAEERWPRRRGRC